MSKPKITDATLNKVLRLMPKAQAATFRLGLKGEEAEFFANKAKELEKIFDSMFSDEEIDGCGKNATVNLHYFAGGCDWWIQAKAIDRPDVYFGYVRFSHMPESAEYGYISLDELKEAGVELDLYWRRVPLRVALEKFQNE